MADPVLRTEPRVPPNPAVDRYLREVAASLPHHRDVDELVAELQDHVLTALEGAHADGGPEDRAVAVTLSRLGDPRALAHHYAIHRSGGLMMPTRFTRSAGRLLILSGVAWLVGLLMITASAVADRTRPWEALPQTLYGIGATALLLGGITLAVGATGVYRRHGRGKDALPLASLALLALGGVAVFAPWAIVLWLPLLTVGAGLLAWWVRRMDIAPRLATLVFGIAPAVAVVVWLLVESTTGFDGGETQQLAALTALHVPLVVFTTGVIALGRWLGSEEPQDEPGGAVTA